MRGERRALLAMVLATLLWGATFVVIKDSLAGLPPAPLVVLRFAAATVVLAAVQLTFRRLPEAAAVRGGIAAGACAAGGFLFQAIGLRDTAAGTSAFLTFAGTLFAALFAWPLLGQRPGPRLVAGMALALAGAALLTLRGGFALGRGEAWTLLGALGFALQIVALGRWAPGAAPVGLALVQSAILTAILLPWSGAALAAARGLDGPALLRLGYLVVAGSVVAPLLQVLAQRDLPAGRVGLLFTLEPLFALLFAIGWAGERFEPRWWLGAGLILLAVILVEAKPAPAPASSP